MIRIRDTAFFLISKRREFQNKDSVKFLEEKLMKNWKSGYLHKLFREKATFKGNVNGIVDGHGCNYSLFGFCLLFTIITCASTIRILAMILYFAPSLGLFNLLHHYQGT